MKIKNISGEDRIVPGLDGRLVLNGQLVDVGEDQVWSYTQQTDLWAPGDKATQKVHDAAAAQPPTEPEAEPQPLAEDYIEPSDELVPPAPDTGDGTPHDSQEG